MADSIKLKAKDDAGVVTVKALINHPMETGARKDKATGEVIPAHFIKEVICEHGGKTIILARFVPIIRTFAPFVAGVGTMKYSRFVTYNVVGGIVWVAIFISLGYFFGNLPFVKKNFELVIFAIIFISFIPPVWEFIQARRQNNSNEKVE